jgi:hypothetical protein
MAQAASDQPPPRCEWRKRGCPGALTLQRDWAERGRASGGAEACAVIVTPKAIDGDTFLDARRDTISIPKVMMGGEPAQVQFSGLSPQFVGLNQINVVVPQVKSGVVPFTAQHRRNHYLESSHYRGLVNRKGRR